MFIRFITAFIDENGEACTGIFTALKFIIDELIASDDDLIELNNLNSWFNKYLAAPDRFSKARNKNPESVSLSWFKDSAEVDIRKMYEIRQLLHKYGFLVEVITTKNPGYIIYEDDYQVSAIPFKTHRKKVI